MRCFTLLLKTAVANHRVGEISVFLLTLVGCLLPQQPGLAQIVPDDTLLSPSTVPAGAETGTLPNVLIEGGTQSNSILFHSFEQFNINPAQQVRFDLPTTVDTIFSRVTGNMLSNIDGELGVNGIADLFFLNPNGVIFGPDARLNLEGAFVVSTAEQFVFSDGSSFSAVTPTAPPLLTLSMPIGLQFGANPQSITVDGASLKTEPGQPLALLGGEIIVNGGDLKAAGGELILGGLSSSGLLTLDLDAATPETILTMPETAARANMTLSNTRASTQSGGNGDIVIYGHNLTLNASQVESGISNSLGSSDSQAGSIILDATGDVHIDQDSRIINEVRDNALGNGGDITLQANSLTIANDIDISTETAGDGRAGNVLIDIENMILVEGNPQQDSITLISSSSRNSDSGATGNVTVTAQEIVLTGDVRVEINHNGADLGGNITLESESFQLLAGASVNSVTNGTAAAGDVNLRASTILLDDRGNSSDDSGPAGIDSTVGPGGENATGGTVTITTDNLTVIGVRIGATVQGKGQGGQVVINASDTITLTTDDTSGVSSSASAIRDGGAGTGGDITLEARRLMVENGSKIDAGVDGSGTSGTITLTIEEDIILQGTLSDGQPSSILTQLNEDVTGVGSDITITTAGLSLADGAQISAATRGNGPGGNVTIQASERIVLTGSSPEVAIENEANFVAKDGSFSSGIFADSPGAGDAGDIEIVTPELVVRDRAQISVSSRTAGASGNIEVTADTIVLDNSVLSADAIAGSNANITLNVQDTLKLRNGSQISTNALGTVSGGNISITNPNVVLLREQSSISAENPGGTGNGGNINIATDFFVAASEGLNRIIANADQGDGGNINIVTSSLLGQNFQEFSASSRFGVDGDVDIDSPNLDPARGTTTLPTKLVDASNQIANACAIDQQGQTKFIATGRGGISITPNNLPTGINPLPDLGTLASAQAIHPQAAPQEDQSWSVAAESNILLTTDLTGDSLNSSLETLLQTAADNYYQANYDQAINLWTQALNALPQDGVTQSPLLSNLALAFAQLGNWQQADAAIIASQQLLTPENTTAQVLAQILNTRASLHLSRGKPQNALADWQQAADAYQQAGNTMGYFQTQLNQAQTLQSLGLYRQAQPLLTTMMTHLADQPPSLLKATTLLTYGHGLRLSGDTAQAQQTLETALAIAQALNHPTITSQILLNLGHITQSDSKQAAYYQKSLEIAPTALSQWQAKISQLHLLATQNPQAAQHLWANLQLTLQQSNFPSNREAIYTQLQLIHTVLHHDLMSSSSESFLTLLKHVNQQTVSLQDPFAQTHILGYQGDFYKKQQQWNKAEAFTQKAFQQAHTLQTPEV
ncbi:MAG: filamentous hemagglutinin N-terminal domain-containing protein, partial [Cyanobacteria bacterium P01_F01_bin.116]